MAAPRIRPSPSGIPQCSLFGVGCLLCFSKNNGFTLSLRVYNSSNRTWDVLPQPPCRSSEQPRIHMVISDASDQLSYKILLPGRFVNGVSMMLVYDSTLRNWTRGTDIPSGQVHDGQGDFYNGSLYIPMRDYNATRPLTNLLCEPFVTGVCGYDTNTKVWSKLPTCIGAAEMDTFSSSKVNVVACVGNDIFFVQSHIDVARGTNHLISLKLDSERNEWTTESDVVITNAQLENQFKCVGCQDRFCVLLTKDPSTGYIYHTADKVWTVLPSFSCQQTGLNGWGMRHVEGVYNIRAYLQ